MGTSYVRKQRTVRIPAITDLQINNFNTGVATTRGSYLYNASIFKYPDGTYYASQRPSFAVFNQPSDASVTDVRGRGVYYWAQVSALYFVNDDTVYKGSYSTTVTNTFASGGTEKIEIAELGDDIIFVDAENNEVKIIKSDVSDTTLVDPADTSNIPASIAHGAVVLDQTCYILQGNHRM